MFLPLPFLLQGMRGLMMLATLFWVWVLIDCITREPSEGSDKVAWTILVIFVPLLGAGLYYFVRRPERIKAFGR